MKLPDDPLPLGVMSLKDVNLHTFALQLHEEKVRAMREALLQDMVQALNQEQQEL